jgi:enamine deaminase RidA (YjgF/YER057c/UK114 family)
MARRVTSRDTINSKNYHVPVPSFSQAIRVPKDASLIYVSGITARQADGTIVGVGDIEAQTRQVLENIKTILAEAGATMDQVVSMLTHVRDAKDINKVSAIRREYFGDPPPTSTTVEISRLYDPQQLIEITVVAAVPE